MGYVPYDELLPGHVLLVIPLYCFLVLAALKLHRQVTLYTYLHGHMDEIDTALQVCKLHVR